MSLGSSIQQLRLREHQLFLALTIVVGVLAGLAAVLFTRGHRADQRACSSVSTRRRRGCLWCPSLVSLVTGACWRRSFRTCAAAACRRPRPRTTLRGGVIPARVPLGKFLTGVLCIGSGHSMGREGPSVQIGAGLASSIGRWLRLPPARVARLVPVGAAGALAAAFNTPVAAVLFALEEIIGDMNAPLLGSTVVASVASVVVERSILGNEPLFHVPDVSPGAPGRTARLRGARRHRRSRVAAVLQGLLGAARVCSCGCRRRRSVFQPAMGGLVIGGLLLYSPAVMGVGYEYVDQALNGGLLLKTMVLLCVLKLARDDRVVLVRQRGRHLRAEPVHRRDGGRRGGRASSISSRRFQPRDPGAYALVGMGTLFAGIIRAPMTSVFMIFEITQDYQILVPLMVANLLSFLISRRYQPVPVYHALLQQDDVHLPSPATRMTPASWTAADVMGSEVSLVSPETSVQNLWDTSQRNDAPAFLVGTPGRLVGMVNAQQLAVAVESGRVSDPIDSLLEPQTVHAHPDHSSETVLERLAQSSGVLPIVSRDDAQRIVGVVTFPHIMGFMRKRPATSRATFE